VVAEGAIGDAEGEASPVIGEAALASPAQAAVPAAAASSAGGASDEPQYIEVWRPRRRHSGDRGQRPGRHKQPLSREGDRPSREARPERQNLEGRHEHRDRRKHRGPRKGDEQRRPRPEVHSSAPPRKGGFDPDSPFAALGELKTELERRAKEQGTT
jgi:ATP-dependent RNA helicase SUPV3L1/SUV3